MVPIFLAHHVVPFATLLKTAPVDNTDDHSALLQIVCIRFHLCAIWIASIDSDDLGVFVKVRDDN